MSLLDHLRNGQQCDEDGVMCIVSRQACHEAADEIERLQSLVQMRDELFALREAARPFAASVFNDNGEVTIDQSHLKTGDWLKIKALTRDGQSYD